MGGTGGLEASRPDSGHPVDYVHPGSAETQDRGDTDRGGGENRL